MKQKGRGGWILNGLFLLSVLGVMAAGRAAMDQAAPKDEERHLFTVLEENREISALCTDGRYVYVGTESGVRIYEADTLQLAGQIEDLSLVYSAGIVKTEDGCIWIGHEKGLTCVDAAGARRDFSYPDIPEGRVNTIAADGDCLWCGTYNGAARLVNRDGRWEIDAVLGKEQGLLSESVNVILPVSDGLLFGSYLDRDGGITFMNRSGKLTYIDQEAGLPHPYITSMLEWDSGTVLVGTGYMQDGGLAVLRQKDDGYEAAAAYSVKDGLPGEKIRCLYQDEASLWITTEYDGVMLVRKEAGQIQNPQEREYLREENGLSDNEIKCIVKSGQYYWLGGKYGLTLIPAEYVSR